MPARYAGFGGNYNHRLLPVIEPPPFDGTQGCATYPVELFMGIDCDDPDDRSQQQFVSRVNQSMFKEAQLICEECPFKQHCAEYAIAHEEYGVWGGLLPGQRKRIRAERGWTVMPTHYIQQVFTPENIEQWQHDTEREDIA